MIEFLLARLAEDEAALETARRMGVPALPGLSRIWSGIGNHPTVSETRLAAEVAAKRAIVERAQAMEFAGVRLDGTQMNGILADLAAVYADHPEYQEVWRP